MASIIVDINKQPNDEKEFVKWMEEKFHVLNDTVKNVYKANTLSLLDSFRKSSFWEKVGEKLKDWDVEYYMDKQVHLFSKDELPEVVSKPYESLLNKAFRKDCLKNDSFPEEPEQGWISPQTWYDAIHDIIRTSFTVKYLDGVKFLDQKLTQIAQEQGIKYECSYEAHDDGYYAAHAAVTLDLMVFDNNWNQTLHPIEIEIQITTELQEMVKSLLHKYYEDNRRKIIPKDYKWQWDYHNEQFVPNFLGHIAHYLEGMIVEIRDK